MCCRKVEKTRTKKAQKQLIRIRSAHIGQKRLIQYINKNTNAFLQRRQNYSAARTQKCSASREQREGGGGWRGGCGATWLAQRGSVCASRWPHPERFKGREMAAQHPPASTERRSRNPERTHRDVPRIYSVLKSKPWAAQGGFWWRSFERKIFGLWWKYFISDRRQVRSWHSLN